MSIDAPTWVGEVELGGAVRLEGVNGRPSSGYGQARVLVRLHGDPIGFLDLPVPPGGLSSHEAVAAAWSKFGNSIRMHLADDGLERPHARPADVMGIPVQCGVDRSRDGDPSISVVVSTHDRSEALVGCLRSLQRLHYEQFEVVVVDNAPSGGETRRQFDTTVGTDRRFRYICEPVQGLSRARNRGLTEARFDHVAFTDDDVVVDSRWLQGIADGFAREPGVVCVTGFICSGELDNRAQRYFDRRVSWSDRLEPRRYDGTGRRSPHFPFDPATLGIGANFAVERGAVIGLGGFDEALGAGSPACSGEEFDIFVRILRSGGVLAYEPSAIVWHFHRVGHKELRRQMRGYGIGFAAFLLKQLHDPTTRRTFARHLPGRVREGAYPWLHHGPGAPYGTQFVVAEIWGYLLGPLAYRRSRRALKRMQAHARTSQQRQSGD